jgi:hypothetical protein
MKHVASLLGVLAVAAMAGAGLFGCAAGTTTTDVGDDGTGSGDDDSGTSSGGKDGGGTYSSDSGGGTQADSGGTSGHDSGSTNVDSGGSSTPDAGTQTFDSGNSNPDTGTMTASCPGDQSYTTQACQTCMDAMCCSEGVACASDQDCQGLIGCLQSCSSGDTLCEDECSDEYSDAVQEYNDLGDCLTASCDTPCGG